MIPNPYMAKMMASGMKLAPKQVVAPGPDYSGIGGFLRRPGIQDALLAAGSALLAQSDQPGSVGGALGRALPGAVQAYRTGQKRAALDDVFANAPEPMRRMLEGLPLAQRQMIAAQMAMQSPPERDVRTVGGNLVEVPQQGAPQVIYEGPDELPTEVRSFEAYMDMSPEERAGFLSYLQAKTASTTVNVNPGASPTQEAVLQQRAEFLTSGFETAQAAARKSDAIDSILEITEREAFGRVSGPLAGRFGQLAAQLTGDTDALEAIAEFQAGGGMMTMQQLEAFTGPKTDFEYRQAQRLVFNDPRMTAEEIQAGLRFHQRVARQEALRWAEQMGGLDLARAGLAPDDVVPQMDFVDRVRDRFGTVVRSDPLGIR